VPARQRRSADPGDGALSAPRAAAAPSGFALAIVVGLGLARAGGLSAQDQAPAQDPGDGAQPPRRFAEELTVTAAREPTRVADTPASVAVVADAALRASAAPALDDAARQVVGFSLFRRTGSRTANPTAQGVSLRGLGASGASRALVLADGIPQNDPFGGWVYWARKPRLGVERLEVMRGGAADLYGSAALGGVVQLVSRGARAGPALEAEVQAGESATLDGTLTARAERGAWAGRVSAEAYTTGGYVPVADESRGLVDQEAASRHLGFEATVERRLAGAGRVFVQGQVYDEERENGTPLQTNDTRIGLVALGVDWPPGGGRASLRAWGQDQLFHQAFSAVAADRSREDLTRTQAVPASALGVSGQWTKALATRHRLLVGADARRVSGTTEETAYLRGAPASTLEAGGDETGGGLFLQDQLQAHPRLLLSASLRLDAWSLREGRSVTTPLATGAPVATLHPDRDERAWSPRLALMFRARPGLALRASGYGAFRAPTLNELYRSFRVGDTVTLANPALEPERLRGAEAGVLVTRGRHTLQLTAFSAEVRDAVANVTLTSAPGLVTRERQNVGRVRSRGLEAEVDLRLGARGVVTAGYALTDARVVSFAADPALEDKRLPQVPRHQATLQARYESRLRLGIQARVSSAAWEDDRNELELDAAAQLDLFAGFALTRSVLLFAVAENVTDAEIVAGRTPVPTLAAPRQLRAGVRLTR
jgi:outer membrane receptor protein involved in Fe transport